MPCDPSTAHSVVEATLYLSVTPCATCRHGALDVSPQFATDESGKVRISTTCSNCGAAERFEFQVALAAAATLAPGRLTSRSDLLSSDAPISAVEEPSTLIDAVQWTTLAQLQLEAVERTPSAPEQRWRRIRAAQCLDEALKFYADDNELPDAAAVWTPSSRAALRDYPQRFARSRLVAMRSALPADGLVERVLARGEKARRQPWWRFWQGSE